MSQFRYALGRLMGGLLALGLFALFLNALILSQQQRMQSALALAGPPPAQVPLGQFAPDQGQGEVNLTARIDAAIDVALPAGTGRLYLLVDPADPAKSRARAAMFISHSDAQAFDTYLVQATQARVGDAPVIALNGALELPYWIDRAELAAAEAGRGLATDVPFVRPFLTGREAGLAPPLLSYLVPGVLLLLLVAHLFAEARQVLTRRRALRALAALDALDREAEETAAISTSLQPGDRQWADVAARRHGLRHRRMELDAVLARGLGVGSARGVWLLAAAIAGLASILPRRPMLDAVGTHLVGGDVAGVVALAGRASWFAPLDAAMAVPGDMLARLVLLMFGPQSIGVASGLRGLPFTVWLALAVVILLVVIRRADVNRSLRGHLR